MHAWRLLALAILVAGLAWLALRTSDDGGASELLVPRRILAGLDSSRIASLAIEHRERGEIYRLERDGRGTWWMTEPVDWRAESAVVRTLFDHLRNLDTEQLSDMDPSEVGLDPARIEVRIGERVGDEERIQVVRIGDHDLERKRVHVALGEPSEGTPVLRVSRALRDTLDLGFEAFRSRRLLDFDLAQVTQIRRTGSLDPPGGAPQGPVVENPAPSDPRLARDLDFHASADGDAWYLDQPFRARLEPTLVFQFLRVLSQVQVASFQFEDPEDPVLFGLDPPWFTVEVDLGGDEWIGLELGSEPKMLDRPPGDRVWYARRVGAPNVFTLDPSVIYVFAQPLEDFLDQNLFQVRREDVVAFELSCSDAGLSFGRQSGPWRVRAAGAADDAPSLRADRGAVEDLLAQLDGLVLADFLSEEVQYEARGAITLWLKGDRRLDVDLGPPTEHYGIAGTALRRRGETRWAFAVEDLCALADRAPADFLSLTAFDIPEHLSARIQLSGLGRTRAWVRDSSQGTWQPDGVAASDRGFELLVDALRAPRVRGWDLDRARDDLSDPIEVFVEAKTSQDSRRFTIWRHASAGSEAAWLEYEGRLGEASPELYDGLQDVLLLVGR